jgi:hypothetical protein
VSERNGRKCPISGLWGGKQRFSDSHLFAQSIAPAWVACRKGWEWTNIGRGIIGKEERILLCWSAYPVPLRKSILFG